MNKTARYILASAALMLTGICLSAGLAISSIGRQQRICNGVRIEISDSLESGFVSREDIKEYLDKEAGRYLGEKTDSIDLCRIEKMIDSKSAVRKSEAYITRDGFLNISVTQRKPAVRFQKNGTGFYADREGYIFPLQSSYTAHVPIIDGAIPVNAATGYKGVAGSTEEQKWIRQVIDMISFMDESRIWSENIVQITVLSNGDLVLIPREGKEKFIFGRPEGYRDKFRKIEKYYTGIVPEKGPGYYSTVNVKYDRQIICRK